MTTLRPTATRLLFWLCLLSWTPSSMVEARKVSFQYMENSTTCTRGDYFNVSMLELDVDCGNEDHSKRCVPGGNMVISGLFQADTVFPDLLEMDVHASELWGTWRTDPLYQEEVNICTDGWGLTSNTTGEQPYCSYTMQPDTYSFQTDFTIPKHWWMNLFVHGVTFRMDVLVEDMKCTGQFITVVAYDDGSLMKNLTGLSAVFVATAIALYGISKKRECVTCIDLCAEEAQGQVDEELAQDKKHYRPGEGPKMIALNDLVEHKSKNKANNNNNNNNNNNSSSSRGKANSKYRDVIMNSDIVGRKTVPGVAVAVEHVKARNNSQKKSKTSKFGFPRLDACWMDASSLLGNDEEEQRPSANKKGRKKRKKKTTKLTDRYSIPFGGCGSTATVAVDEEATIECSLDNNHNNNEDDSVTTTAYTKMTDFSPKGLSRLEKMDQLRNSRR